MSILWCGGEDIDFPNGAPLNINTGGAVYRPTYARCGMHATGGDGYMAIGNAFSGGAVSSCWLAFQNYAGTWGTPGGTFQAGLCNQSAYKGITIGTSVNGAKIQLYKIDGTSLAAEVGYSLVVTAMNRIDIQVIGPLSSATVNVYVAGVIKITWTGDLTFGSTITGFDSVWFSGGYGGSASWLSEFIVADEDTRA